MGNTTKPGIRWGLVLLQGAAFAAAIGLVLSRIRVSPGDLAAVHEREPQLDGSTGCTECHGDRRQSALANSCATCHRDIQGQIASRTGLHGSLPKEDAESCGRCHGEHKGKDFRPVNRLSFALAGIQDSSVYAHETISFLLSGKHLQVECSRCHGEAEAAVLPKGAKRFLGLDQTCSRCHKDVHEGAYGPQCQTCHGQEQPFKNVPKFQHPDAFPLTGGHAGVACASCHAPGTLQGRPSAEPVTVRACTACHRSPHGDEFLSRIAQPISLAPKDSCVRCHTAEQGTFLGPHATITRKQHAAVGFPLTPPHHQVQCQACHAEYGKAIPGDPVDAYHQRYPGRSPDDCRSCHQDPHRGEFEIGTFKGRDCLSCHSRQAFQPAEFDMTKHDEVFRLEGRHRKLRCDECHKKTEASGPRDYRGVPVDCRSCHQDPHGGQFDKALYLGNDCRVCHTQASWRPPTFTTAMHAKTPFALTGAHLGTTCNRCHADVDAAGKPCPRKFSGVPGTCVSCHKDVHQGAFDGPERPVEVAGRKDCERCHATDSFRALTAKTFDHPLWTGFALNGAHAKVECGACHGRSAVADAAGRTLGFAAGKTCQSCHSDPHAGQFGPTATVDCAKCHREEGSFKSLTFNHQKDTRFPLDEVHLKVDCAKCHKPMPVGDGVKAIRYKPLGIRCADCHDPRGKR